MASAAFIYDHVPNLRELLPTTAGIPGVQYAQVSVTNLRKAQDEGWVKISGAQKLYTINGPSGKVDCELYAKGKPIPGQGVTSGARICYIDKDIYAKTGLGKKAVKPTRNAAQSAAKETE